MREFDAVITGAGDGFVVLDRTCFFPQGGGQAGDRGTISGVKVVNTLNESDEVRHIVEGTAHLAQGQAVHGIVDWERRYRIMRLHTASHLVYYIMQEIFGAGCRPTSSGMLDELKDRSDYLFEDPLDKEKLAEVEDRVNQLISKRLSVTHGPEPGSGGRFIWRTAPFPPMECGGTHVRNTSEIGRILLKRGSKPGRGRERIELTLA
jgi:Ser-tRNA(Ala) deacylase AlaX